MLYAISGAALLGNPASLWAYEVQFEGPAALRALAERYSDLARFRTLEDISNTEISRLMNDAPVQLSKLFATEGYFNPVITVRRADNDTAATSAQQTRIIVTIEAGPQTRVTEVTLEGKGAVADSAQDPDSEARTRALRNQWLLNPGQPFQQSVWEAEKQKLLISLWTDRYPAATLSDSEARVDADANTARLKVSYDSGPLFRYGQIRVRGLREFPRSVVDNLTTIKPGQPYTQKDLLDLQDRLLGSGLFDAASAQINPDPAQADAATVDVRLRESAMQTLRLGLGYSTMAGPRATVEHSHNKIFGFDWQIKSTLKLARDDRSVETELLSYPQPNFYRNLIAANLSRVDAGGMVINQQQIRVGRRHDADRIKRLYYLSLLRDRTNTDEPLSGNAVWGNYEWRYLDVDSPIFPTKGYALSAQAGGGLRFGEVNSGEPFGRLLGRLSAYYPLTDQWLVQGRFEMGQVLAKKPEGIPQTLLFRIGGTDTVRGYGYQSIGIDGPDRGNGREYVAGGRFMMLGGVEVMREIVPNWYGAVFVDAGDASHRLTDWSAKLGYGVGARWRSPVGPMKIDISYGQQTQKFRLDISVGITF